MAKYSFWEGSFVWRHPEGFFAQTNELLWKGSLANISDKGGLHIDEKIVGLSISKWLPCPLAIWNLLFGMAILLNRVK